MSKIFWRRIGPAVVFLGLAGIAQGGPLSFCIPGLPPGASRCTLYETDAMGTFTERPPALMLPNAVFAGFLVLFEPGTDSSNPDNWSDVLQFTLATAQLFSDPFPFQTGQAAAPPVPFSLGAVTGNPSTVYVPEQGVENGTELTGYDTEVGVGGEGFRAFTHYDIYSDLPGNEVPEPSTWTFLLFGAAALSILRDGEVRRSTMKTTLVLAMSFLLLLLAASAHADVLPGDPRGGPTPDAIINISVAEDGTALLNDMPTFSVLSPDEDGNMRTFFSLRGNFVRGGDVILTEALQDSDLLRFHNPGTGLVLGYADWFTLYSDEPHLGDNDPADLGLPIHGNPDFADPVSMPEDSFGSTEYKAGTATYGICSDPSPRSPEPDSTSCQCCAVVPEPSTAPLVSSGMLLLGASLVWMKRSEIRRHLRISSSGDRFR